VLFHPDIDVAAGKCPRCWDSVQMLASHLFFFAAQYRKCASTALNQTPTFSLLKRNVCQERRIVPIFGAIVGYQRKQVYLTTDAPAWGNSISTVKMNTVAIKAHTIGEICRKNGLTHIDLLTVDIEGAEKSCLRTRTLLNEWAAGSSNLTRIMHSMRLKRSRYNGTVTLSSQRGRMV
jgi:FkbM family methyltransferase